MPELSQLGQQLCKDAEASYFCNTVASSGASVVTSLVDFGGLAKILIAAARTCDCDTADELQAPFGLVMGLAAQTAPLDALRDAQVRDGAQERRPEQDATGWWEPPHTEDHWPAVGSC